MFGSGGVGLNNICNIKSVLVQSSDSYIVVGGDAYYDLSGVSDYFVGRLDTLGNPDGAFNAADTPGYIQVNLNSLLADKVGGIFNAGATS